MTNHDPSSQADQSDIDPRPAAGRWASVYTPTVVRTVMPCSVARVLADAVDHVVEHSELTLATNQRRHDHLTAMIIGRGSPSRPVATAATDLSLTRSAVAVTPPKVSPVGWPAPLRLDHKADHKGFGFC